MKYEKNVMSSAEIIQELEIGETTVYERSNVRKVKQEDGALWVYDEIQYSLHEYLKLIDSSGILLKSE